MTVCAVSLFLSIFPIGGQFDGTDRYDELAIHACQSNQIQSVWIADHIIHIENRTEHIRIPLPPVRDPTHEWILFDLGRDWVQFGDWGKVWVRRGPKAPL